METGYSVWIHVFSVELDCLRTLVSSVLNKFSIYLFVISFRMVVVEQVCFYR